MVRRRCRYCRWWRPSNADSEMGYCKRYPPVHQDSLVWDGDTPLGVKGAWLMTYSEDQCGEFYSG